MFAQFSVRGVEIWSIAGWTMLHFLWLGTLVLLAAMTCRLLLRRASADVRYAVALVSLAVLAVLPVGIGVWLAGTSQAVVATLPTHDGEIIELKGNDLLPMAETAPGVAGSLTADDAVVRSAVSERGTAPFFLGAHPRRTVLAEKLGQSPTVLLEFLNNFAKLLPWLWFVGTPLTFGLLATGIVGAERLRRGSRLIHDGPIAAACARLRQSLGMSTRVAVAVCERIAAPVLVGIVRPIILLPPSALTGWSPDEIEMVLLHELAHVRRWDNLVNLGQRLIESLLFFHPAVWLVSGWVRREREACCDAMVVRRTNRPQAYAEMLVALAAQMPRSVLFHPAATSAMAAGPLRARINRILQLEDDPMLVSGKSFAVVLGGLLVAGTLAVLYLPSVGQAEESATEVTENTETSQDAAEQSDDAVELTTDELRLKSPVEERLGIEANHTETENGRVLLSVPMDGQLERFGELFQAVEAARSRKQQVDLVARDSNWDLVVVPPQTEADWPTMLGDPPRKERVIADKAWQQLGLKLVPASQLETWERDMLGRGGGIKIIGGNVPNGLPLPAFVRQIGGRKLDNFDDLNAWLTSEKKSDSRKISAVANGHDYLFDATPPVDAKPATSAKGEARAADDWLARVPFPSSDEAEIARRAWKELGFKVVPASEAELEPLKRRNLRGGLKLVDFEYLPQLEEPYLLTQIQTKALSTGVASFRDLERVLDANVGSTDDHVLLYGIAKQGNFQYAMRRPKRPSRFPTLENQKLADLAWKMLQLELEPISGEELKHVKATGYDGGVKVVKSPMYSDGIWNGDILLGLHVWPTKSLEEVAEVLNREDLDELNPLKFYVLRMNQPPESSGSSVVSGRVAASPGSGGFGGGRGRRGGRGEGRTTAERYTAPTAPAPAPAEAVTDSVQSPSAGVDRADRAGLRYDGKRFDEWRSIWKNELSTERRLEAAKALAAFGRAGWGKEAADAILEVAGEYDFRTTVDSDTPEGKLQRQILDSLASGPGSQSTDTLTTIIERHQAAPGKWQGLLAKLLLRKPTLEGSNLDQVRLLLKHEQPSLRSGALVAIVARDPQQGAAPLTAAISDPDASVRARALQIVESHEQIRRAKEQGDTVDVTASLEFPVEQFVPLLLRSGPEREGRNSDLTYWLVRRLSGETAAKLVGPLTEILKDPSRADDHLAAVRALGAMGDKAAAAMPDLDRVFNETEDMRLRVATAYALDRLNPNGRRGMQYRSQIVNQFTQAPSDDREQRERQKKREELDRLLEEEQSLMR